MQIRRCQCKPAVKHLPPPSLALLRQQLANLFSSVCYFSLSSLFSYFPSPFLLLAAIPRSHLAMLPEMDSAAAPDGDGGKASEPQPEVDGSVISIPALSLTEAGAEAEEAEEGADALDDANAPAQLSAPTKKKRRNNKSTAARGPLALPKNRGNGFEGMHLILHSFCNGDSMLNNDRVFCRPSHDSC